MPSTREVEKSWNLRKFDLWPAITGSNIDLGPQIIPPIASTRREQSAGLFREALRRFVWKRQGGVAPTPPPLHRRRWRNTVYRARVKVAQGMLILYIKTAGPLFFAIREKPQGGGAPLLHWWVLMQVNPRPHWGGGGAISSLPSRFLAISSKPMPVSPPNLQYPLSQHFYTLC